MTEQVLIGVGAVLNIIAILLLLKDCYRGYGSTMGGEMLAGLLWTVGAVLLVAGIYLASGQSMLWGALSLVCFFLIGLPCRWAVIRLGSKYGKPSRIRESPRFAEHVKRENALRNKKK